MPSEPQFLRFNADLFYAENDALGLESAEF